MFAVYLIVILLASTVGAVSGVGGGVMIKPIFDAISPYDTYTVSILSCFSVLTMSATSVAKQIMNKVHIQFRIAVPLAVGAIVGGLLGNFVYNLVRQQISDSVMKIIQAGILASFLAFVVIYMNRSANATRRASIRGICLTAVTGLVLGMVSTFIGIGGGPINIAVLCLMFALDIKDATVNSLVLIVFSQISKLIENIVSGRLLETPLPWTLILCVCVIAAVGGLVGAKINRALTSAKILRVYTVTMLAIISVNIYNIIHNIVLLLN